MGQNSRTCSFKEREQKVDDFTSGIRVVLLFLDASYSLLLTKDGQVTDETLDKASLTSMGVHAATYDTKMAKSGREEKQARVAQEAWEELNLQPSRRQGVQKTGLKRQNRTSTLTHRMATAAAYRQWREGPGAATRDHLKAWA